MPNFKQIFLPASRTSKELVHITHQAVELASIHCHVQIWNDIKALSFFNILQLPLQAFCCKSSAANNKHYTGWSKRIKCLSDHLVDHLTLVENSRLSPGVKHFSPDEGTTTEFCTTCVSGMEHMLQENKKSLSISVSLEPLNLSGWILH